MRIILGNIKSTVVFGGKDNLLTFDLEKKVRNYMRIKREGYRIDPRFKWQYFITPKGTIATGFTPLIVKFAEGLGASVELVDERGELPKLKDILSNEIGTIDGVKWFGRDYQMDMVKKLNKKFTCNGVTYLFPRGIYDCATNAGKNSITALIVKNLDSDYKSLFMVSNQLIFKQAVEFFSQVVGYPVGQIKSGRLDLKQFTVAMVKTTLNRADESLNVKKYLKSVEVLIVDESDESGSKQYAKLLQKVGAGMRVFVSGTPLEAKKSNNMKSIGLSGTVLGSISNKFLIDNGYSQNPLIKILLNDMGKQLPMGYPTEEQTNIFESKNRMRVMFDEALVHHRGESVLVSFFDIQHGENMFRYFKDRAPDESISIVHGGMSSKIIADRIKDFAEGRIKWLIASTVIKKGANLPTIRAIIFGAGGMSVIFVKQILGRGTRTDGIHSEMNVYDMFDTGKYLAPHSRKRIKIYAKEEFDITFNYLCNKAGTPVIKK